MTCVLNDGESVLAMVFRQENRHFRVLTPRRTNEEDTAEKQEAGVTRNCDHSCTLHGK